MSSKQRLVYGIVNGNLVLMPQDTAKAFAADHQVIRFTQNLRRSSTRLQPQSLKGIPGLDEDDTTTSRLMKIRTTLRRPMSTRTVIGRSPAATIPLDKLPG